MASKIGKNDSALLSWTANQPGLGGSTHLTENGRQPPKGRRASKTDHHAESPYHNRIANDVNTWMTAAAVLVFLAIGVMVLTEVLRSVIHARRKSQDGLGGTQDIAMWGVIICLLLLAAASVCLVLSFLVG